MVAAFCGVHYHRKDCEESGESGREHWQGQVELGFKAYF